MGAVSFQRRPLIGRAAGGRLAGAQTTAGVVFFVNKALDILGLGRRLSLEPE